MVAGWGGSGVKLARGAKEACDAPSSEPSSHESEQRLTAADSDSLRQGMSSVVGGRCRWAFKLTGWQMEGDDSCEEFRFLLGLLPKAESEAVVRFKHLEDKQRALISRLLQRKCVELALDLEWAAIDIQRTKGRKPFVASSRKPDRLPNFNFNVSHEGDYIVLASEPTCVVGVDVAAPGQLRRNGRASLEDIFQSFERQFTKGEWRRIKGCGSKQEQMSAFRRNWSCKEAFTKARGDGIGFELQRSDFDISPISIDRSVNSGSSTHVASVKVDGVKLASWMFYIQPLGDHWVTVARGPPKDIVDAYGAFTTTLTRKHFTEEEWQRELREVSPGFALVNVADLLPVDKLAEYKRVSDADPFA